MIRIAFLIAVMVVIGFGTVSVFTLKVPAALTAAEPRSATIYIDELHRQVDMRSLPETEVRDPY